MATGWWAALQRYSSKDAAWPRPLRPLVAAALSFMAHNATQQAGHVAFSAFLSIFPFFIFLITIAGNVGQSEAARAAIDYNLDLMPEQVAKVIRPLMAEVLARPRGGLMTLGFLGTLWAVSSSIDSLRLALEEAYGVHRPRPFWRRRAQGVVLVLLAGTALIASNFLMILGPLLWRLSIDYFEVFELLEWRPLWDGIRYGIGATGALVVFALLYRWLPNLRQDWRNVLPGAALAVMLWVVVASGFGFYLSTLANTPVTYGSLGGVAVTLLFFYLSAMTFIFGAEFNAALSKRRGRGT
ncbi:MAG: YihY/virulence factor BrkB family protein [Alphaproteobacteria bacterium]|nr:YihY/virulence factor BrkB family protein [Alphaproteobacteria bacterium]